MITLRKFGMNENEIIKYEKDNEQKLSKKVKNLYLKMDLFTNLDEKYIQELEKMIGSNLPKDYRDFQKPFQYKEEKKDREKGKYFFIF